MGGLARLQRGRDGAAAWPMTGPATSASCATSSSAPSIAGQGRRGRSRTSSSIRSKAPGGRLPARRAAAHEGAGHDAPTLRRGLGGGAAVGQPPAALRPEDCADFRLAVAEYEKAILAAALEKMPLEPARRGDGAEPDLRPAPPRDAAARAAGRLTEVCRPFEPSRKSGNQSAASNKRTHGDRRRLHPLDHLLLLGADSVDPARVRQRRVPPRRLLDRPDHIATLGTIIVIPVRGCRPRPRW